MTYMLAKPRCRLSLPNGFKLLLPRFPKGAAEVVTFYGEGPTGLAGGLALRRGAPDFALGRKVGRYLMDAVAG